MQVAIKTLSCIFVGTFCVRARGAALKDLVEAGSTENEVCASNGAWLEPLFSPYMPCTEAFMKSLHKISSVLYPSTLNPICGALAAKMRSQVLEACMQQRELSKDAWIVLKPP